MSNNYLNNYKPIRLFKKKTKKIYETQNNQACIDNH